MIDLLLVIPCVSVRGTGPIATSPPCDREEQDHSSGTNEKGLETNCIWVNRRPHWVPYVIVSRVCDLDEDGHQVLD